VAFFLDIFGLPDTVVEEGGDVVLASAHLQVDRFIAAGLVIHLLFAKLTVLFKIISQIKCHFFSENLKYAKFHSI
jgi:hypothetical protein